jgi:hypothetical protein
LTVADHPTSVQQPIATAVRDGQKTFHTTDTGSSIRAADSKSGTQSGEKSKAPALRLGDNLLFVPGSDRVVEVVDVNPQQVPRVKSRVVVTRVLANREQELFASKESRRVGGIIRDPAESECNPFLYYRR